MMINKSKLCKVVSILIILGNRVENVLIIKVHILFIIKWLYMLNVQSHNG